MESDDDDDDDNDNDDDDDDDDDDNDNSDDDDDDDLCLWNFNSLIPVQQVIYSQRYCKQYGVTVNIYKICCNQHLCYTILRQINLSHKQR